LCGFGQNIYMITKNQALAFARSTGWSSRLPEDLQAELLAAARLRILAEGTRVYAIGDPPGGLAGLVSGCLAGEAAQSGSPPHKSLLLHPGAWIGEGPAAGLDARIAGIWATRKSAVLAIEIADFRRVAAKQPEAWSRLALLALENHGRTMGLVQDLMVRGGLQRLFAILARLGGLREECVPDPSVIDATQTEIADIANLSRSVVSRFLQEMEADGILRLRRANIEILDPTCLLSSIDRAG
jgi:CRP-like cAMP-binding protein